jgi:hypothetical protein
MPHPVHHDRGYLGAFAQLGKATISFVMSVCLSIRVKQLISHWKDFDENLYLSILYNMSIKFKFHKSPTRITAQCRQTDVTDVRF